MSRFLAFFIFLIPLNLSATSINHRLNEGDKLDVQTDITKVLREDNPNMRGISIHGISGYLRHPFAIGGKWQLEDTLVRSIKKLEVPNSRIFMISRIENGKPDLTEKQIVDRAVELYTKLNIPLDKVVMCLNNDMLKDPKLVLEVVDHGLKQGFVRWEIGNEPWHKSVPSSVFNRDAKEYHRQALKVAKALRTYSDKILIYIPSLHDAHGEWGEGTIKALAGYYDFVAGHHYAFSRFYRCTFEGITLTENYMILQNILDMNDVIAQANPGKEVHQWDTEWGQHSKGYNKRGEPKEPAVSPVECFQNANIQGTLHRAVRLIHYHREFYMKGATQWEMFSRIKSPGFGILTRDEPNKAFMPYWLNYYFADYIGDEILDISGTCPYYTATKKEHFKVTTPISGPIAPVLASFDKEKQELYYIIANGSWTKSIPCDLTSTGFKPGSVSGIIMSDDDYKQAHPLVHQESDFVKPFQATVKGNTISCTIPPHSIVMMKAKL